MAKRKLKSGLVGVAGEYFVAAELSRRGYIASLTQRNSEGVDILCTTAKAKRALGIQVKTSSYSKPGWIMNEKAERFNAKNPFYVFVNLKKSGEIPDFFIIPSKIVSDSVRTGHAKWLATPGKRVKTHKDTSMRYFRDRKLKYLNRWDLLGA